MPAINEYYHVYNRGAHKAPIFLDGTDYHRFLCLLYIANNTRPIKICDLDINKIFLYPRTETLVDVIAYCLMPNHFHLVLLENIEKGIERFLHKMCTAYVMYYNKKYDHSGTIFQGQYKSKHVDTDEYLRYLIQYVHLNPYGIEEPEMMKTAKPEYLEEAWRISKLYQYSSLKDYLKDDRPQKVILVSARVDFEVYPRG